VGGSSDRPRGDALNSLRSSPALLVAANPPALFDPGLQLSFLAAAGLIVIAPL